MLRHIYPYPPPKKTQNKKEIKEQAEKKNDKAE